MLASKSAFHAAAQDWVEKISREDIKSVVVKVSIVRAFNRYAAESLKRNVWSKGCTAWYSKKNGPWESNTVMAMYPRSALHYKEYIKTIRGKRFDIQYNTSNPSRYLGNGELELERAEWGEYGVLSRVICCITGIGVK